jgi:hypothetical protein
MVVPRISYLGSADQIVQRHVIGLRKREERLQARAPLSRFQPAQGAFRDPSCGREAGQGSYHVAFAVVSAGARPVQAQQRSQLLCHPRPHPMPVSQKQQRLMAKQGRQESLEDMSHYDVVVIGGGAAGLSAALVLSRARRKVLVVNSGTPRNGPAQHIHGFLSRDGWPPGELLAFGRDEVKGYGGGFLDGSALGASSVVRRPDGGSGLRLRANQARSETPAYLA